MGTGLQRCFFNIDVNLPFDHRPGYRSKERKVRTAQSNAPVKRRVLRKEEQTGPQKITADVLCFWRGAGKVENVG
jgi:hypothetical protein